MSSFIELRAQASALGITVAEAKKYGDIRHKRTWSLAIEHHQATQVSPPEIEPPSTISQSLEFELTLNVESTDDKIEVETALLSNELNLRSQQISDRPRHSTHKSAVQHNQPEGWKQVVQKHLKALQAESIYKSNQPYKLIRNWQCPECKGKGDFNCYLCGGAGYIDDTPAKAWTLAYMELLGCSPEEIQPLRSDFPGTDTLQLSLQLCQTIKESALLLARTDKWVNPGISSQ